MQTATFLLKMYGYMRGLFYNRLPEHGNYEFFVKFAKYPRHFAPKMNCIVEGYFFTVGRRRFYPQSDSSNELSAVPPDA